MMKKLFLIIVFMIAIPLVLVGAILVEDTMCLRGLSSPQINREDIPIWIRKKVVKELEHFKVIDSKSFAIFDKFILEGKLPRLGHFKIRNNKVSLIAGKGSRRAQKLKNKLEQILKSNSLQNLEFILYSGDGVHYGQDRSFLLNKFETLGLDTNKTPPVFMFAANKIARDRKNFILLPDTYLIGTSIFNRYGSRWSCLSAKIAKANSKYRWSVKEPKAFWRGGGWSFLGHSYNKRDLAVSLSRRYPELLDAKYAPPINSKKKKLKYLYKYFSIDPWAHYSFFVKHKIILDLEGNTVSYQGIYWKMFSNSVVLKQLVNNECWVSDQFIPWIHFVPIKEDLSDLIEKIYWVKNNDDQARKIAESSTNFIKENLTPEHIDMYIYHVLDEYSKRLTSS